MTLEVTRVDRAFEPGSVSSGTPPDSTSVAAPCALYLEEQIFHAFALKFVVLEQQDGEGNALLDERRGIRHFAFQAQSAARASGHHNTHKLSE